MKQMLKGSVSGAAGTSLGLIKESQTNTRSFHFSLGFSIIIATMLVFLETRSAASGCQLCSPAIGSVQLFLFPPRGPTLYETNNMGPNARRTLLTCQRPWL
jgi:hypothetical protein